MISVSSGTRKIERHKMIDDVNSANRGAPIKMHKINSLERRLTNLPSSSSSLLEHRTFKTANIVGLNKQVNHTHTYYNDFYTHCCIRVKNNINKLSTVSRQNGNFLRFSKF